MLKSYIMTAFRSLLRRKGYTIVTSAGWAVGMACCLLIALYVLHEYAYDRFYSNAERIYRVVTDITTADGTQHLATSSGAIASATHMDIPEVISVVRLREAFPLLQHGTDRYRETVYFADSTFFDVFDVALEQGNTRTALTAPSSAVLTDETAAKYFGAANPLGQTLTLDAEHELTVTGVLRAFPGSSHLDFDVLVSMALGERAYFPGEVENWGVSPFYTYLFVQEDALPSSLDEKLKTLVENRIGPLMRDIEVYLKPSVEPLTSIYLQSERADQIGPTGSARNVYAFATLGLFILLVSSLNVVNLTVARMTDRTGEAGVRKALGASRRHLITQFIGESLLLALLGAGLALVLGVTLLPLFNALSGTTLTSSQLLRPNVALGLLVLSTTVGTLSGIYPALLFARSKTVHVLRGSASAVSSRKTSYRGLVILQFAVATTLMACTAIVYIQLRYVQDVELGFEATQTLIVDYEGAEEINRGLETLKAELLRHPVIQSVSASSLVPGEPILRTSVEPQRLEGANSAVRQVIDYRVDYAFADQYELELVAGRSFSEDRSTDATEAIVINEAMVRALGFEDPETVLGEKVNVYELNPPRGTTSTVQVIGVIRDFHVRSLHEPVEPMVMRPDPSAYRFLAIRLETEAAQDVVAEIEHVFERVLPQTAITYRFLDERFDEQYGPDVRFGRTFATAAALAIFLACLGLNGLSAHVATRRRKEIGVRKALGASSTSIIALLSKDLLVLVMIALALALPIAYVLMEHWLTNFAYQIGLGPGLFVVVGGLALLIALLAVGYQAAKAAGADPIQLLRYE